jgi:hypothetical protein
MGFFNGIDDFKQRLLSTTANAQYLEVLGRQVGLARHV